MICGEAWTVEEWNMERLCGTIISEAEKRQVELFVLGLPKNMDGSEGPRAEKSRAFCELLQRNSDLEVVFWDERRSSIEAHQILHANGKKEKKHDILFDGKHISEIDRSVFTGSLAVVDQDITLFEDTIANNIKMWDESIEDFEMILAARDAQIYDDIMAREGGFNGRLTEGGKDLSGGQRQRLEIARVLAQDPSIIIMDEATSALDAKTEYELVKAVKDRGITCIVIAHRLSTIRDCDEIIVLDKGVVVERGTHEELYAKGGVYTELIASD